MPLQLQEDPWLPAVRFLQNFSLKFLSTVLLNFRILHSSVDSKGLRAPRLSRKIMTLTGLGNIWILFCPTFVFLHNYKMTILSKNISGNYQNFVYYLFYLPQIQSVSPTLSYLLAKSALGDICQELLIVKVGFFSRFLNTHQVWILKKTCNFIYMNYNEDSDSHAF